MAGRLLDEHPGVYLQSHLAENRGEVAWVAELYPWSRSYLDVYDHFGLVRERAVYAHCIHLDTPDRARMAETGAAMVSVLAMGIPSMGGDTTAAWKMPQRRSVRG